MVHFLKRWLRGSRAASAPARAQHSGIDQEHLQLRRAIERCDSLKFAVIAKQMSILDVVEKLQSNNFTAPIIRQAIAESFGEAAAKKYCGAAQA
ncbi:hypothetical protein HYV74_04490 [Candidatus Uhrbacteria bacterium]|nr:hypothetical protein [Candidatus Uhrbacteria bacterium]